MVFFFLIKHKYIYMKYIEKRKKIMISIFVMLLLGLIPAKASYMPDSQEGEWGYRVFFQLVETYENGTGARFTGCVTLGGSCLTQGPNIDQDCLDNGKWSPCGFE